MNTEKITLNKGIKIGEITTLHSFGARPVRMNRETVAELGKEVRVPVEPAMQNANAVEAPIASVNVATPIVATTPIETITPAEPTLQSQITSVGLPNGIEPLNPIMPETQESKSVDSVVPEMSTIASQAVVDATASEMPINIEASMADTNNQTYDFNQEPTSTQMNSVEDNKIPAMDDSDQPLDTPEEVMNTSIDNDNKEEKEKPTIDEMIKDIVDKKTEEKIETVKVKIESILQKVNMLEEKINKSLAEIDRAVKAANNKVEQAAQSSFSQVQTTEQADVPYQRVA